MFARLHTRRSAYTLIVLAIGGLEVFFGWRAAVMYATILAPVLSGLAAWAVLLGVWGAISIFGFALATLWQYALEAVHKRASRADVPGNPRVMVWIARLFLLFAISVIVIHDIAGAIYTVFAFGGQQEQIPLALLLVVTIGMSALSLLPFLIGYVTPALAESLAEEREAQFQQSIKATLQDTQEYMMTSIARKARKGNPEVVLAPFYGMLKASGDSQVLEAFETLLQASDARQPAPPTPSAHVNPLPSRAALPPGQPPDEAEPEEPPHTITDAELVAVQAPTVVAASNGDGARKGGSAASSRPFRFSSWRQSDPPPEEDEDPE